MPTDRFVLGSTAWGARGKRWRWRLALLGLWLTACDEGQPAVQSASATAAKQPVRLPALTGPRQVELGAAAGSVVVRVPVGATQPRPLTIVLRSAAQSPGPLCDAWRQRLPRSFVMCPALPSLSGPAGSRALAPVVAGSANVAPSASSPAAPSALPLASAGKGRSAARAPAAPAVASAPRAGVGAGSPRHLARAAFAPVREEVRAAVKATKGRFGAHVSSGSVLLVADGTSVPYALRLMREEPSFFARVVVVGSDFSVFSSSDATIFGKKGGKRLLFVCETAACLPRAAQNAQMAYRAGAESKAVRAKGDATSQLAQHLSWLVQGDQRFAPEP